MDPYPYPYPSAFPLRATGYGLRAVRCDADSGGARPPPPVSCRRAPPRAVQRLISMAARPFARSSPFITGVYEIFAPSSRKKGSAVFGMSADSARSKKM